MPLHLGYRSDKDTLIGPINACIYCGDRSYSKILTHEHVLPEALGGRVVLLHASCSECKEKIDPFESKCINQMFADARAQIGFKKTKARRRKKTLKIKATIDGQPQELIFLPRDQHPTMVHLPIWDEPGLLYDRPSAKSHTNVHWWAGTLDSPEAFQKKLEAIGAGAKTVELQIEGKIIAGAFSRLLAKIAHCMAIAAFGFESFKPFLLNIIKDDGHVTHLIGSSPESRPSRTLKD